MSEETELTKGMVKVYTENGTLYLVIDTPSTKMKIPFTDSLRNWLVFKLMNPQKKENTNDPEIHTQVSR